MTPDRVQWEYASYQVRYTHIKDLDRWGWSVLFSETDVRTGPTALVDFLNEMGRIGWELASTLSMWWQEGGYGTDVWKTDRHVDVALLVFKRTL